MSHCLVLVHLQETAYQADTSGYQAPRSLTANEMQQQQQFITCSSGNLTGMAMSRPKALFAMGTLVALGSLSLLVPASTTAGLFAGRGVSHRQVQAAATPPLLATGPLQELAGLDGVLSSKGGTDWMYVAGTCLGWVSSVLYLLSRVSQIYKNWKRQSAQGLAISMFMMAVCANICTGTGIALRTFNMEQLRQQAPWIMGSLGTVTLDMIILWQSRRYGSHKTAGCQQQQQQAHDTAEEGSLDAPLLHASMQ